ncbi:hypothetical protein Poly30_06090 [Planctomycetes bacterium Poly30]|uniref:Glycosyltransferase RgtA/B/C/D-like domain-containing protein n=2 Tax=Saltatorellus ferox TaxID=2528018 RepID=A0A518ELZ5_9BACT|nr:hypothetical protein Poly30_06090 [Planctomycetes bacterium Poly30]
MSKQSWLVLIAVAAAVRLMLAWFITDFVLVDDAYITLRYARNAADSGALVYNHGEAVFGVTSPLWGFVTWGLMAIAGTAHIATVVIGLGVLLWSLAAARLVDLVPDRARGLTLAVFLCAPVFVDNQMLGMETPLFVWLAVEAMAAALSGAMRRAAFWTGLLVVARPEGVLFAPALLFAASASEGRGLTASVRELTRPVPTALLLTPGLLWIGFALSRYGTVLPQSMVAKSGWNSEHYDSLGTALHLWLSLARLTFVPFVDYLPALLGHAVTAALVASTVWITRANLRRGTAFSRAWLIVYGVYMAFYLAGKGATEASWYAVPSSVALLLAAGPALPERVDTARRGLASAVAAALMLLSIALVQKRAPLLQSYVDGYGACASALEALDRPHSERVLIGEIGVFGFQTEHLVIDVGALVSPEVLPIKNARRSLLAMARETDASWLVISDIALERNFYPSVGVVWENAAEREWLESSPVLAHERDKRLIWLGESERDPNDRPPLPDR